MDIRYGRGAFGHGTASGALVFTLIELMVTIAVLAIVMAIATPSFIGLRNSNRLTSQANTIVATLQQARSEAVRLNRSVRLCRSDNGTACASAAGQWSQWIIRDAAGNILSAQLPNTAMQVTASVTEVVFHGDGLARTSAGALLDGRIVVCLPATLPEQNQRVVSIASGGRIATTAVNNGGTCP